MRVASPLRFLGLVLLFVTFATACRPERRIDPGDGGQGGSEATGGLGGFGGDRGSETTTGGRVEMGGGPATGGDSGEPTGPEVVSSAPSDGSVGVPRDADLVLTFSRRMNVASVEAAFGLFVTSAEGEGRVLDVDFEWNASRTELTVRPLEDFPVRTVTSPTGEAWPVRYSIGVGASDADGNELAEKFEATFTTLKRVTHTIGRTTAFGGPIQDNVCSAAPATDYVLHDGSTSIRVGRRGPEDCPAAGAQAGPFRAFMHFSLAAVPREASLLSAVLDLSARDVGDRTSANDWATVGSIRVARVNYTPVALNTLSASALGAIFTGPAEAHLTPEFTATTSDTTVARAYDITTPIRTLLENRNQEGAVDYIQYRAVATTLPADTLVQIDLTKRNVVLTYDTP